MRGLHGLVPGTRVVYRPSLVGKEEFLGTVDDAPTLLGGTWVVRLRDMDPTYRDGARSTVPAACVENIRLASAFDVAEIEARPPPVRTPIRHFSCCICNVDVSIPVMTTPDPECPEMFQLPPGAWMGTVSDADGIVRALLVCGQKCLDTLMAVGWCQ